MGEKTCSRCKKPKNVNDFHKNKARQDGLEARCKSCVSLSKKKKYKKTERQLDAVDRFQIIFLGKPSESEFVSTFKPLWEESQ